VDTALVETFVALGADIREGTKAADQVERQLGEDMQATQQQLGNGGVQGK